MSTHAVLLVFGDIEVATLFEIYGHMIRSPTLEQRVCQELLEYGTIRADPAYLTLHKSEAVQCIVMQHFMWNYWPGAVIRKQCVDNQAVEVDPRHYLDLCSFSVVNKFTRTRLRDEMIQLRTLFVFLTLCNGSHARARILDHAFCEHVSAGFPIPDTVVGLYAMLDFYWNPTRSESD